MTEKTTIRLRFTAAMLALPSAVTIAAVAWVLWATPRLPDPMATHFSGGLRADGFSSPGTFLWVIVAVTAAVAATFAAMAMTGVTSVRAGKVFIGIGAGSIAFGPVLAVSVAHPQLELSEAADFHLPAINLVAALLGSIVIGVIAAMIIRPRVEQEKPVPEAEPIAVTESSRAAWFASGRVSLLPMIVIVVAILVTAVAAVLGFRAGDTGLGVGMGVTAAIVALTAAMFAIVRVRIDASGVRWSLGPGFPRGHVPLGSIRSISAVELKPSEWGGWGYRLGGQGTAILLRGGEGLRIEKADGSALFISVDDATRGAALAQGYLAR